MSAAGRVGATAAAAAAAAATPKKRKTPVPIATSPKTPPPRASAAAAAAAGAGAGAKAMTQTKKEEEDVKYSFPEDDLCPNCRVNQKGGFPSEGVHLSVFVTADYQEQLLLPESCGTDGKALMNPMFVEVRGQGIILVIHRFVNGEFQICAVKRNCPVMGWSAVVKEGDMLFESFATLLTQSAFRLEYKPGADAAGQLYLQTLPRHRNNQLRWIGIDLIRASPEYVMGMAVVFKESSVCELFGPDDRVTNVKYKFERGFREHTAVLRVWEERFKQGFNEDNFLPLEVSQAITKALDDQEKRPEKRQRISDTETPPRTPAAQMKKPKSTPPAAPDVAEYKYGKGKRRHANQQPIPLSEPFDSL
jgi:hypothetical protein